MKQGIIRTGAACVLALTTQGCATGEDQPVADTEASGIVENCHTVFHCPSAPEDIRICLNDEQLHVLWQAPGTDAYRLSGALGQTFRVHYSQTARVIRNTLSWQHQGSRYQAYHYLDESRPETLEAIGVTVDTNDKNRTITCSDNAVSDMDQLHQGARKGAESPAYKAE